MDAQTARFAIAVRQQCEDGATVAYAQRITKTHGHGVLAIWTSKPHRASAFTYTEALAFLERHPTAFPMLVYGVEVV
jgi:hypothetical protein